MLGENQLKMPKNEKIKQQIKKQQVKNQSKTLAETVMI